MPHILHPLLVWPLLMEHLPWSSNYFHHTYHHRPTATERPHYPLGNLACRMTHLCPPAAYVAVRSHGTNPELNSFTYPSCPTAKMTYLGTVSLQLPPSTLELNWLNNY